MSYLRFEKALMTNLQESLPRELLRTNRSGAYACSTIVDCNTRKYHGLLVVPIPELDDDNHVLLSSFDPSVIQHGVEFQLGLHKYKGEAFSPNGHKYIREFDCEKVPTTLYRVGGVKLRKELVFQHYDDRVLIRYTLVDAHSETKLRFRPFLAFRSVKQFTHENPTASREYEEIENGIRTRMYAGYPYLYMQFSKKPTFVFHPDWYRDLEYPKEQERGYASRGREHHLCRIDLEKRYRHPRTHLRGGAREAHTERQLRTLPLQRRTPVSQPLEGGRKLYPGGIPVVQMPRTRHLYRPARTDAPGRRARTI